MSKKIVTDQDIGKGLAITDLKLSLQISSQEGNTIQVLPDGVFAPEGAGTDTNEVQFGTETKTVKAQIEYETCTLVFTELLNHNRNGKRMFVCTDVIQDGDSLIEESTEVGDSRPNGESVVSPSPTPDTLTDDFIAL